MLRRGGGGDGKVIVKTLVGGLGRGCVTETF